MNREFCYLFVTGMLGQHALEHLLGDPFLLLSGQPTSVAKFLLQLLQNLSFDILLSHGKLLYVSGSFSWSTIPLEYTSFPFINI